MRSHRTALAALNRDPAPAVHAVNLSNQWQSASAFESLLPGLNIEIGERILAEVARLRGIRRNLPRGCSRRRLGRVAVLDRRSAVAIAFRPFRVIHLAARIFRALIS